MEDISMRRFKHLSKTDRLRMEAHLRDKKTPKEIAEILGVHISTIYREKKRGEYQHRNSDYTEETRYSSDLGEMKYRSEGRGHKARQGSRAGRVYRTPDR